MTAPDLDPRWSAAIRAAGQVRPAPDVDAAWAEVERRAATPVVELGDRRPGPPRWAKPLGVAAVALAVLGIGSLVHARRGHGGSVRAGSPELPVAIARTFRTEGRKDWTFAKAQPKNPQAQELCFAVRRPNQVSTRCQPVQELYARPYASTAPLGGGTGLFVAVVPDGRSATIALGDGTPLALASVPGVHVQAIRVGGNPFTAYSARVERYQGRWPGDPGSALRIAFGPDQDVRGRFDASAVKDWKVTVGPQVGDPSQTCVTARRKGGGGGLCWDTGKPVGDQPSTSLGRSSSKGPVVLLVLAPSDRSVRVGFAGSDPIDLGSIPGVHRDAITVEGRRYVVYTAAMFGPLSERSAPTDGLGFTWGPTARSAAVAKLFAPDFPKDWTVSARVDGDALCVGITRVGRPEGGSGCSPFPDGHHPQVGYGASAFDHPNKRGLTQPIPGSMIFHVAVADGHTALIRPRGAPVSDGVDVASVPGLRADEFDVGGTHVTVYSGVLLDAASPTGAFRPLPVELAWN